MRNFGDFFKRFGAEKLGGREPQTAYGAGGVISRDTGREKIRREQEETIRNDEIAIKREADRIVRGEKLDEMRRQETLEGLEKERILSKRDFDGRSKSLMDNLNRTMDRLSEADRIDKMETIGSSLRLADEKYLYDLEDTGRRERLDDAQGRDWALKKAVFDDQLDMLEENISFQQSLDMEEADFIKWLADLDIETALSVAESAARSSQETAMISGLGTATRAGMAAYADREDK